MKNNTPNTAILVIEDEAAIRDMIQFSLQAEHFQVLEAGTIRQAKTKLANQIPNLILLDWMLPEQSGIHFIYWLKKNPDYRHIPIIMLTAKAEEENRILGLESGADDYVVKPFSPRELIARIKTVLRRGILTNPKGDIIIHDLTLSVEQTSLTIRGQVIPLTKNEYQLLHFFMTHPDKTYSRCQLIQYVWGNTCYIDERTVDAQIKRIRHKLKDHHCDQYIATIRGLGYQFLSKQIPTGST